MGNPTNNAPVEIKTVSKKSFKNKKLFIIVGVVILIIVSLIVLYMNNLLPFVKKQALNTAVQLKTEYKNPFDEKTKYENPFSEPTGYQNPFDF